jgi:hypothetical protein
VEKIPKKGNNLGRNSSRHHCGAQSEQWCASGIYRLNILVTTDVSQPIQKIIGISWLTSADTINHIIGIGCTMSADTNNVSGIRGVTPLTQNPNHGEFFCCAIRLPKFPTLCAAASLNTAYLDATSLGASVTSLDATPSPSPSSNPPSASMPHRRQPSRSVAIAFPDPPPTPSRHTVAIAVPKVGVASSPTTTSPTILLSTRILKVTTLHKNRQLIYHDALNMIIK